MSDSQWLVRSSPQNPVSKMESLERDAEIELFGRLKIFFPSLASLFVFFFLSFEMELFGRLKMEQMQVVLQSVH